jgi:hypothetical protein
MRNGRRDGLEINVSGNSLGLGLRFGKRQSIKSIIEVFSPPLFMAYDI